MYDLCGLKAQNFELINNLNNKIMAKKETFKKGEKATLVIYLPKTEEVEVIEQAKYKVKTKIKSGNNERWVETIRLRKII
jgi:hypothetical protein